MAPKLNHDVVYLIAQTLCQDLYLKTALELSLTSQTSHQSIYKQLLYADASLNAPDVPNRIGSLRHGDGLGPENRLGMCLWARDFFIENDDAEMFKQYSALSRLDVNSTIHWRKPEDQKQPAPRSLLELHCKVAPPQLFDANSRPARTRAEARPAAKLLIEHGALDSLEKCEGPPDGSRLTHLIRKVKSRDMMRVLLDSNFSGSAAYGIADEEMAILSPRTEPACWGQIVWGPPSNDEQPRLRFATPTPLYDLIHERRRLWLAPGARVRGTQEQKAWIDSLRILIEAGATRSQGLFSPTGVMLEDIFYSYVQCPIDSDEIWTLLVEGGVLNIHDRNAMNQTYLGQLVSRCYGGKMLTEPLSKPNLIRSLVKFGVDINAVGSSGLTPLDYAILYGEIDTVQLLVELGANPFQLQPKRCSPAHHAFGEPFSQKGPVAKKVLEFLRRKLMKHLHPGRRRRNQRAPDVLPHLRNQAWHPTLTVADDVKISKICEKLVADAEYRAYSIIALLEPYRSACVDDNGHTPGDIVSRLESLNKLGRKIERQTIISRGRPFKVSDGPQKGIRPHHKNLRAGVECKSRCYFCYPFPPLPVDITLLGIPDPNQ
ncbi:Uu.00g009360.m01.CDS01 [Anthostomella pinea]|uniref:Uu.00g009360.m01.CDS01 n=1 Tax=Anthostomella pinea TaxID=933095 RepID=A0AAI8VXC3_9PEZI|nr:Uu.00g009360.m01.CDS01 [Anthostomella pinea]